MDGIEIVRLHDEAYAGTYDEKYLLESQVLKQKSSSKG
jgi:hypothetical protein